MQFISIFASAKGNTKFSVFCWCFPEGNLNDSILEYGSIETDV